MQTAPNQILNIHFFDVTTILITLSYTITFLYYFCMSCQSKLNPNNLLLRGLKLLLACTKKILVVYVTDS